MGHNYLENFIFVHNVAKHCLETNSKVIGQKKISQFREIQQNIVLQQCCQTLIFENLTKPEYI